MFNDLSVVFILIVSFNLHLTPKATYFSGKHFKLYIFSKIRSNYKI